MISIGNIIRYISLYMGIVVLRKVVKKSSIEKKSIETDFTRLYQIDFSIKHLNSNATFNNCYYICL